MANQFKLLNVDFVKLGSRWNFSNVISPYYRIYYIEAGEGHINTPGGQTKLLPGQLYLIPSFTLCDLHCGERLSQYFLHFFEESTDGVSLFGQCREIFTVEASEVDIMNFKRLLEINPGRGINRPDNPRIYEKNIYYKEYTRLNDLQSQSTRFETNGIILQLLSRFMRTMRFTEAGKNVIPSVVMAAVSHIQINLTSPIKVHELAATAKLNTDYFSRLFQRFTGYRPIEYILEKRVERAQHLIITTDIPCGKIAELTGFDNPQYFSRLFRKKTGLSPKQYRKQYQDVNLLYPMG